MQENTAETEFVPASEYLNKAQLAAKLQISLSTLEKRTAAHQVPGQTRFGRIWRYYLPAIEKRLLTSVQFFLDGPRAIKLPRGIGDQRQTIPTHLNIYRRAN